MTGVHALPNRTFQVSIRVARGFSEADIAFNQARRVIVHDLVHQLFEVPEMVTAGLTPADTIEYSLEFVDELFVDPSISTGVDVHIHIDARGFDYRPAQVSMGVRAVLPNIFPEGDFCYQLTINHNVSVMLLRTQWRQEHREQEYLATRP